MFEQHCDGCREWLALVEVEGFGQGTRAWQQRRRNSEGAEVVGATECRHLLGG